MGSAAAPGTATWPDRREQVTRGRGHWLPGCATAIGAWCCERVANEAENQGRLRERRSTLGDHAPLFECRFDAQF